MPDERVIDFAGQLRERDRRRIDAVMEQGALEAAEEEKAAAARPKAPAPEKPRTMLEGVPSAAGSAAWDSFQHGVTNVAKAVYRGVNPAARIEDPFQVAAHGQGLLGVLQIVTAPYAGFGAAAQQALANYSPGKEREVAFKGGANSWVGYFRTMLGVPQLLLDPETRKQDPQLTVKMLEEDMTYGEFLNILTATATGFVVTPGSVRAVGRRLTGGAKEAPKGVMPPPPEAPPPTTLRAPDASMTQMAGGAPTQAAPAAPLPLPRTMGDLMAQKGVPAKGAAAAEPVPAPPRDPRVRTMDDIRAEAMATAPDAPAAATPEGVGPDLGPMTPEQVAEQLRLSLEQPRAAEGPGAPKAGAETPEAAAAPKHPLVETYEGAVSKAQEIIDEAFSEDMAAAATPEEVAGDLPARTGATMGEAIALSSPSGQMSGRARTAAQERLRVALFGEEGLAREAVAQPAEREMLLRQATELRDLADRGMSPRKHRQEAERLETRAAELAAAAPEAVPTPEGAAEPSAWMKQVRADVEAAGTRGREAALVDMLEQRRSQAEPTAQMRKSDINTELDRLERDASQMADEMIRQGRGTEKPTETRTKTDALSEFFKYVHDRSAELRQEIKTRMGPSAPERFPKGVRGFGPRERGGISGGAERRIPVEDVGPADAFDANTADPNFYYHVTTETALPRVLREGLQPGRKPTMAAGALRELSKGKVFLTDREGVSYWSGRIAEHLEHEMDNPPNLVVVRVPREAVRVTPDPNKSPMEPNSWVIGHGQVGAVSAELLARMAVGAAIGAVSGDEENAIRNGLIGLGVGAAVRGPLAAKLAVALKDQTGGIKWRPRPAVSKAQEPYQPNYSHVQAEAEVLHVMKNVHRAVADQITEGMKRPTTHSETTKAAADLITSGEVTPDSVLKGATVDIETLPAYGKAVRDLAVGSAAEVVRIARAIEAGEAVPPGQIRQAAALTAELSIKSRVMKTRGGQFVEAFKIKAEDPGFVRESMMSPDRVAELADQMAPDMTDADFAKAILADARTPRVQEMTTFMQALPAALLEAMYGSMFSGVSILRNGFGTLVMAPLAIGARGAGSLIARAESLVHTPASRIVPGEAGGMLTAWWEGIHEQVSLMRSWKAWQEAAQAEGKLQEVSHQRRAIDRLADTLDPGPVQSILRGFGQVIRKPLEIMNGTDASGVAIARRMELKAQAIRQATVEGLEGPRLGARVEEIMQDPAKLTPSARERVVEFEKEQTFTKDLEGTIGSAIQRGPERGTLGGEWSQFLYRAAVVPIFRTAVRIAEGQLEYSGNPITTVLAKRFREDMLAGGARRQLAEGKMALGLTMTGLFVYLASQDWITGSAPTDPNKRALWGRPEESFWTPGIGGYRSYKGFQPLTAWLRASADLWRYAHDLPEMDYAKLVGMHALLTLDNMESESWWLGISDTLKVFTDRHGKDEMVDAAMDVVRKRLAQWSPGFFAELEKGVDPQLRSSRPSGAIESPAWREYESLKARYATRTPFWSTAKNEQGRDLYPVQRDPLDGTPRLFDSWPFSVAPIQRDRRTPARNEIDRLQPAGLPLPDHIGGSVRATGVGLDPPRLAPASGILLGRDEKDRWVEIMTQQVKDPSGQPLLPALEKLVQSPMYLGTTDKPTSDLRKRELLSHKIHWFQERAEERLLTERPDLGKAVKMQQAEKRIQRQSPADQPGLRQMFQGLLR